MAAVPTGLTMVPLAVPVLMDNIPAVTAVPNTNPPLRLIRGIPITTIRLRNITSCSSESGSTSSTTSSANKKGPDYNTYNTNQQAQQQAKYTEANTLQTNNEQTEKDMHYQSTQTVDNVSNNGNSYYGGGGGGSNNDSSNTGEVLGAAALGAVGGMAVGSMMTSAATKAAAPPPNPYAYYPPPNPYGYYPPPAPPPAGYQPYYNGSRGSLCAACSIRAGGLLVSVISASSCERLLSEVFFWRRAGLR